MAAGVAHEMNHPLTYVYGNLTYVLKQPERGTPKPLDARQALSEALPGSSGCSASSATATMTRSS